MNHESGKVALACAIGAGIGALIALEIVDTLWWIGPIVGLIIGYLSYEWRAVVSAVPKAYRATRQAYRATRRVTRDIETPEGFWTAWLWLSAFMIFCRIDFSLLTVLAQFGHYDGQGAEFFSRFDNPTILIFSILVCFSQYSGQAADILSQIVWGSLLLELIAPSAAFLVTATIFFDRKSEAAEYLVRSRKLAKVSFPPFFFAYYIPKWTFLALRFVVLYARKNAVWLVLQALSSVWCSFREKLVSLWLNMKDKVRIAASVVVFIFSFIILVLSAAKHFTQKLFIYIHSDRRLICGVDAGLGATIGFFAGSAIIGALAGGMLGLINYELVSKRWFKLEVK